MLAVLSIMKWSTTAAGLVGLAVGAFLGLRQPAFDGVRLHPVALPDGSTLQVMTREVTKREWKACANAGICEDLTGAITSTEPDMPMTGVNRFDVEAYIGWVNAQGQREYRLPTAKEWNAIAATLPRTSFKKLFDDPRMAWAADYGSMPALSGVIRPSGSFGTLSNGISDLGGNVWEWTATCAKGGFDPSHCPAYKVEGPHETVLSVFVRDPFNGGCASGTPPNHVGFRLVTGE